MAQQCSAAWPQGLQARHSCIARHATGAAPKGSALRNPASNIAHLQVLSAPRATMEAGGSKRKWARRDEAEAPVRPSLSLEDIEAKLRAAEERREVSCFKALRDTALEAKLLSAWLRASPFCCHSKLLKAAGAAPGGRVRQAPPPHVEMRSPTRTQSPHSHLAWHADAAAEQRDQQPAQQQGGRRRGGGRRWRRRGGAAPEARGAHAACTQLVVMPVDKGGCQPAMRSRAFATPSRRLLQPAPRGAVPPEPPSPPLHPHPNPPRRSACRAPRPSGSSAWRRW